MNAIAKQTAKIIISVLSLAKHLEWRVDAWKLQQRPDCKFVRLARNSSINLSSLPIGQFPTKVYKQRRKVRKLDSIENRAIG